MTMRIRLAGWLHTATPVGNLLAAGASFLLPVIGWRGVFLLGVLPALLTVWLRRSVPEPKVWQRGVAGAAAAAGAGVELLCGTLGVWLRALRA